MLQQDPNPRPQTHALDYATIRINIYFLLSVILSQTPQAPKKKINVMTTTVMKRMKS